jgi:hypothetical protein
MRLFSREKVDLWLKSKKCMQTIIMLWAIFIPVFFVPLLIDVLNDNVNIQEEYFLLAFNFMFAVYFLNFARNSIIEDEESDHNTI